MLKELNLVPFRTDPIFSLFFPFQRKLDKIAHPLNTRHRAALEFLMPIEAYQAELDKLNAAVVFQV